eukprot:gb/GECG01013645.1/.p1 GENE.gb/GECG01013645.1/~~gb/GECG01013645.1/.p1  ORF type:complete len:133 (+),score=3.71 gb/GECG01013645.1/:1-399(+)
MIVSTARHRCLVWLCLEGQFQNYLESPFVLRAQSAGSRMKVLQCADSSRHIRQQFHQQFLSPDFKVQALHVHTLSVCHTAQQTATSTPLTSISSSPAATEFPSIYASRQSSTRSDSESVSSSASMTGTTTPT